MQWKQIHTSYPNFYEHQYTNNIGYMVVEVGFQNSKIPRSLMVAERESKLKEEDENYLHQPTWVGIYIF